MNDVQLHQFLPRLDTAHVDDLMRLFSQAWWTRERSREQLIRLLETSIICGLVDGARKLCACARIISDQHCKAVLVDVIVDSSVRGQGLGRRIVIEAINHPEVDGVEDLELYCHEDLVGFYASLGFIEPSETRFMRRSQGASGLGHTFNSDEPATPAATPSRPAAPSLRPR